MWQAASWAASDYSIPTASDWPCRRAAEDWCCWMVQKVLYGWCEPVTGIQHACCKHLCGCVLCQLMAEPVL